MPNKIKITETPRDGLQSLDKVIATDKKLEYIKKLLQCGFYSVEVGSLVSPKLIPQMADTVDILKSISDIETSSRISVLVANKKGGDKAVEFDIIDDVFYPFSVSETFLKKNINQDFEGAMETIEYLQNICVKNEKTLVPFLSMGLGNPYGDEWSLDVLYQWSEKFRSLGINFIPVSDIMGEAEPEKIESVFKSLISEFPDVEFGLHLHSIIETSYAKVSAAWKAGIRRFDTVMGGLGGCPMTGREMTGNLNLKTLLQFCTDNEIDTGLDKHKLEEAEYLNMKMINFVSN